jgi:hypothetical protein
LHHSNSETNWGPSRQNRYIYFAKIKKLKLLHESTIDREKAHQQHQIPILPSQLTKHIQLLIALAIPFLVPQQINSKQQHQSPVGDVPEHHSEQEREEDYREDARVYFAVGGLSVGAND